MYVVYIRTVRHIQYSTIHKQTPADTKYRANCDGKYVTHDSFNYSSSRGWKKITTQHACFTAPHARP